MRVLKVPAHRDERGLLVAIDEGALDFIPRRVFVVSDVPDGAVRGEHLVPCRQAMVLTGGTAEVELRDAAGRTERVPLRDPGDGVLLEPGEYVRYRVAPGGTVVVFAAEPYRPRDPA